MRKKVTAWLSKLRKHEQEQETDPPQKISDPILHHTSATFKESKDAVRKTPRPGQVQRAQEAAGVTKKDIQHEFGKLLDVFDEGYTEFVDRRSINRLSALMGQSAIGKPLDIVTEDTTAWSPRKLPVRSEIPKPFIPATPIRGSSRRFSFQCGKPPAEDAGEDCESSETDSLYKAMEALSTPFKIPSIDLDLQGYNEFPNRRLHSPLQSEQAPAHNFEKPSRKGKESSVPTPCSSIERPRSSQRSSGTFRTALVWTEQLTTPRTP